MDFGVGPGFPDLMVFLTPKTMRSQCFDLIMDFEKYFKDLESKREIFLLSVNFDCHHL